MAPFHENCVFRRTAGALAVVLSATLALVYLFESPDVTAPAASSPSPISHSLVSVTRALEPTPTPSSYFTATAASPSTPTPTAAPDSAVYHPYPRPVDEAQVAAILAQMSLEQKVGQMLMVGLPQPYMDEVAWRRVAQQQMGGVIFLERNITGAQQVAEFTQALQASAREQSPGLPLLIGWNHEGGPVVRDEAQLTVFPSAMAIGAAGQPELAYRIAQATGKEMRSLGVNMSFAPVLDVISEPSNPVIGLRAFGDDPALVAEMG
ncbi:MAG TPA: glycoside hydrolase family 3 N-terminal domain-containing protein, partial [Candidatus Binatia bacterium]|nr:glycoside hydrolase family 3 N-terminal domain-containing protein [Candidatus Binatia bacterium]